MHSPVPPGAAQPVSGPGLTNRCAWELSQQVQHQLLAPREIQQKAGDTLLFTASSSSC